MSNVVRCDTCAKDVMGMASVNLAHQGKKLDFCDARCVSAWAAAEVSRMNVRDAESAAFWKKHMEETYG